MGNNPPATLPPLSASTGVIDAAPGSSPTSPTSAPPPPGAAAPPSVAAQMPETQPEEEEYSGPLDEEGRPHGIGTMLYARRDPGERAKFYGEWVHGKRSGWGLLLWRNGSRYEGHFVEDKLGGQGVLSWALGLEYRGQWTNNYAHGRGELRFPNGKRYTGEWALGKRHGWGHLTFPPNDDKQRVEYVGGWADVRTPPPRHARMAPRDRPPCAYFDHVPIQPDPLRCHAIPLCSSRCPFSDGSTHTPYRTCKAGRAR